MNLSASHPRWAPYFFIGPFVVVFAIFVVYPLFQSLVLSFQQTYGPQTSVFVGTKNFADLAGDPAFWTALRNTFVYAAASVLIQLPLSLGLAMLLNRPQVKGRAVFRLVYFSPALVGIVFIAVIFSLIFQETRGLLNVFLKGVIPGFPQEFPWLQVYVMPALVIASIWMYTGFNMIYFLAALQNVDRDQIEAAVMDGANRRQVFWHVTLPAIRPVAGFVILLSAIGSMQLFELPWILLGGAGPEDRGLTVVMYLFMNGFQIGDLGYASAIGWSLAILLMGMTWIQRRLTKGGEGR
ncbi:MAG: sugar ABC transporter permease [Verrucomicrobiota bacterium]